MATVWNSGSFGVPDYHLSNSDDNESFLDLGFDEFDMICKLPSIQGDIERISAISRSTSLSFPDSFDDIDLKPEIRNVDCMWSATANNSNNNSGSNNGSKNSGGINSAASSYSESSAVPPSVVSGGALLIKREPEEEAEQERAAETEDEEEDVAATTGATTAQSSNSNSSSSRTITIPRSKPLDISCNGVKIPSLDGNIKWIINNISNTAEQHIPPGASLLRKSNTTLAQNRQKNCSMDIPSNYRSNLSTGSNLAPLKIPNSGSSGPSAISDEHLPVFRHNVDLAACVMGSNNISLTNCADANYIDHLSRELQNTSKERIDMLPYRVPGSDNIVDVLDVISQQSDMCPAAAVSTLSPPASSSDCDSDDGECSVVDSATSLDGNCMQHISDHSYTRCNEMETNLETPSDSGELANPVSK